MSCILGESRLKFIASRAFMRRTKSQTPSGTDSMKALVCRALAPNFEGVVIEDRPEPVPKAREVLVRMRAASVNFPDVLMAEGKYQFKPELPFVMGMEGAGEVAALGPGVDEFKPGDKVLVGARAGAMAEFVAAPVSGVRPLPAGLSFAEGAAHSTAMLTAYVSLVRLGQLKDFDTILIHGAAGGVGFAAVKLAQHLKARVIATASTPEKRQFLSDVAKAQFVLSPDDTLRDDVFKIRPNEGVDVCYDPVGGDVFDRSVRCMRFGGRYLIVGFASGRIPTINANYPLIKGFSLVGVRAGEYGRTFPALGRENIQAIDRLAAEGLTMHIGARFPLADGKAALRELSERRAIGKVVVEM
jgi:NADPH2:quinone reductase